MNDAYKITQRQVASKPSKPYPDFPLFPHATKRWAKKIRGKMHYFGPWDDPIGSLNRYLQERDDLFAGRVPNRKREGARIADLCNQFLSDRQHRLDAGEIVLRTWKEYHASCERVVSCLGKDRLIEDVSAEDFLVLRKSITKTRGPVALGNEITRIRVVFKFAYDSELVDKPIRFGPTFKRPSPKILRKQRAERAPKRLSSEEIRALLENANIAVKAMILLGINCGLGNGDVARLKWKAISFAESWLNYPRPKSGVSRTCPLWPETLEAIQTAQKVRPVPKDSECNELVFITKYGKSWYKQSSDNPISQEFRKLLDHLGFHREGVGFYALRHTFETEAGETGDQVAVNHIMGHAPTSNDMSAVYREGISRDRLKRVTDHVRAWLFGTSNLKNTP